ncbi:MAG: 50S ribosomal protein L32 [Parachlamydiales bacterium]
MAVPRNRHSTARKNSKRSHHAKKPVHTSKCTNCGAEHRPHRICPSCGTYKGSVVVQKAES